MVQFQFDPVSYVLQAWALSPLGKTLVGVTIMSSAAWVLAALLWAVHSAIRSLNDQASGLAILVMAAGDERTPHIAVGLAFLTVLGWIVVLVMGSRVPSRPLAKLFRTGAAHSTLGPISPSRATLERFVIEIFNDANVPARNCFARLVSFQPKFSIVDGVLHYPQAGDPVPWLYGDEALHNITIPPKQSRWLLVALQDSAAGFRYTFTFPVSAPSNDPRPVKVANMADRGGYEARVQIGTEEITGLPTEFRFAFMADESGRVQIHDVVEITQPPSPPIAATAGRSRLRRPSGI